MGAEAAERIDAQAEERRREPRRRTLKAGRILIDKKSVLNCTVRNLSAHGSRIEINSVLGVPEEFLLDIAGETPRKAQVIWKTYTELGVALG